MKLLQSNACPLVRPWSGTTMTCGRENSALMLSHSCKRGTVVPAIPVTRESEMLTVVVLSHWLPDLGVVRKRDLFKYLSNDPDLCSLLTGKINPGKWWKYERRIAQLQYNVGARTCTERQRTNMWKNNKTSEYIQDQTVWNVDVFPKNWQYIENILRARKLHYSPVSRSFLLPNNNSL